MDTAEDSAVRRELFQAKARIDELEKKIAILEGRIPQKFPDVHHLSHKDRKRILVCIILPLTLIV